jgi:hypothetical protein
LIRAAFALCDNALQSFFLREPEKLHSSLIEVAPYLNSCDGSNDFLQSFSALNNALAGQVTPIVPKQIKQE